MIKDMKKKCAAVCILSFLIPIISYDCVRNSDQSPNCVVTSGYSGTSGAIIDGKPVFTTIGEALSYASTVERSPFIIGIAKGRYEEKVTVVRPDIWLMGESRSETIISHDATADTQDPNGE